MTEHIKTEHFKKEPKLEKDETYLQPTEICWGSIFAGSILAIVIFICLNLLGLAIGFANINPASDPDTFSGVPFWTGVWTLLSALAALFSGGFVAARLGGNLKTFAGGLHGLITWAVVTLVTVYLAGTAIGGLVSGSANLVSSSLGAITGVAGNGNGSALSAISSALDESDISLQDIKNEAAELLRQTEKRKLQPEYLENQADQAAEKVKSQGRDVAKTPGDSGAELENLIDRLARKASKSLDAFDERAAANILAARTDVGQAKAQVIVERWSNQLQRAESKLNRLGDKASRKVAKTAEAASAGIAGAAFWSFLAILLGAFGAVFGGLLGSREEFARILRTRDES